MSATAVQVLKALRDYAQGPVNANVSQYDLYEYVHGEQDLFGKLTNITSVKIKDIIQIQPSGGKYVVPWVQNDQSQQCMRCASEFTLFYRRHHCRFCGFLICNDCSVDSLAIDVLKEAELVSRRCKICKDNNVTIVDTSAGFSESTTHAASLSFPASAEFTTAPTEAANAAAADPTVEDNKEIVGSSNATLQQLGSLGSHTHQTQDLHEQEQLDVAATEDEALLTVGDSNLAVSSHRLSQDKPLLQSEMVSSTIPENNTQSGSVATEEEEQQQEEEKGKHFFDSSFAGQTPQVNRTMSFGDDKAKELQTTTMDLTQDLLQEEVAPPAENTNNTNDNDANGIDASEGVKEVASPLNVVADEDVEGGAKGGTTEEEEEDTRNSTSNNATASNSSSKNNKKGKKNKGKRGK